MIDDLLVGIALVAYKSKGIASPLGDDLPGDGGLGSHRVSGE